MTSDKDLLTSESIELLKNFFEEVWVQRKPESLENYCLPTLVYHKQSWGGRGMVGDFEHLKELVILFKQNFSAPELQIQDIFAGEENKVVVRWSLNAERLDEIQKERLVLTGLHIYRFDQGKIAEIWGINLSNFSYDF